jgi:hypothetical protein
MSAEILILCARLNRAERENALLSRLLSEPLDWPGLIRSAVADGVAVLAYRAFKEYQDRVPREALEQLKGFYYGNAARYLRLRASLGPLIRELSSRGFRFAFTKGIRLAGSVYEDFALRPFTDIDLLVHPRDGARIEAALGELGFKLDGEGGAGLAKEKQLVLRTYSPYFRRDELLLEVHYDALGLQIPLASEEDVWAGVCDIEIGGFRIPVLSTEDELCHLCLHVMEHSYSRLIWLTDIAELVSRHGLDWDKLKATCRREGIGAPVYYGLFLADRLWPGAIPREALGGLRPGPVQRGILELFWPVTKVRARRLSLLFPFFMPTFFALIGRKDPGLLIRTVLRTLFPPRAWVAHYYGTGLGPLRLAGHYLWRIQRPFVLVARRLLRLG